MLYFPPLSFSWKYSKDCIFIPFEKEFCNYNFLTGTRKCENIDARRYKQSKCKFYLCTSQVFARFLPECLVGSGNYNQRQKYYWIWEWFYDPLPHFQCCAAAKVSGKSYLPNFIYVFIHLHEIWLNWMNVYTRERKKCLNTFVSDWSLKVRIATFENWKSARTLKLFPNCWTLRVWLLGFMGGEVGMCILYPEYFYK